MADEPLNPGTSWYTCDPDVRAFVERVVALFRARLAERLLGVYLHGSFAMGCYNRARSDIDLLIISDGPLPQDEWHALLLGLLELSDERPTLGDLELSVVQAREAALATHPIPYDLHFGDNLTERIRRGDIEYAAERTDPDLAAHFTVTRARGITLYGPPPSDLLGSVPWADYVTSVVDDLRWIVEGEHFFESPYYGILNACRVLQLLIEGEGTVSSKRDGAEWALQALPTEHHPLIRFALGIYRSAVPLMPDEKLTGGVSWDREVLLRFSAWVDSEVARLYPEW